MCGITGFYFFQDYLPEESLGQRVQAMVSSLSRRGPDSSGIWINQDPAIALGHSRLAIRDLSPLGHQPMISSCGRYVLSYNGEIYSHREITRELRSQGKSLKGTSDTEVILESCALWGVEKAVQKFIGMFAFALYDRQEKSLYLVRDRLGIKPLYWTHQSDQFIFGSELKALVAASNCTVEATPGSKPLQLRLDPNALATYLRHNYIPSPHSIYQGVYKLEPGVILKVQSNGRIDQNQYWKLEDHLQDCDPIIASSSQGYLDQLESLLQDAVGRRMVSDVPIGSLLSGGIDSSLVTALMAEQSANPIHTYSIGFKEDQYNEAPFAKAIARHLGTKHTELYVEPGDALDIVSQLPAMYDEPFADSSQIPTAILCNLTRKHVTVVLSGDGGDELFAGYSRYHDALRLVLKSQSAPKWLRHTFAHAINILGPQGIDCLAKFIPGLAKKQQVGEKAQAFAKMMQGGAPDDLYRHMISLWSQPEQVIPGAREHKGVLWDESVLKLVPDFLKRMQYLDTKTYLPDDILTKVDRASMHSSLEVRVPLLDHRLVEMAFSLPQSLKVKDKVGKYALRQILYKRVPQSLIDRPKMGFGVPIDSWLRGPLRDWCEHLLDAKRLKEQGIFDPQIIQRTWKSHLSGTNNAYQLWTILMAQAWIDHNPHVHH